MSDEYQRIEIDPEYSHIPMVELRYQPAIDLVSIHMACPKDCFSLMDRENLVAMRDAINQILEAIGDG